MFERRSPPPLALVVCTLAASAVACGEDVGAAVRSQPLRGALDGATGAEVVEGWFAARGLDVSVRPEEGAFWVDVALAEDAWEPGPDGRSVRAETGVPLDLERLPRNAIRLASPATGLARRAGEPGEGPGYSVAGDALVLGPVESPSDGWTLSLRLAYAEETAGDLRPTVGRYTGDGIALLSGTEVALEGFVKPGSVLRFATAGAPFWGDAEEASLAFAVELDGRPVFRHEEPVGWHGSARWHEVVLPESNDELVELRFSVAGDPATAAFLAPVIGPGESPASGRRPSLILFLADTLRADSLAHHGGAPDLAPSLNRLAEKSVRFANVLTPTASTLPSQASMMTGLYPEQHAAVSGGVGLPDELVTLAEHLQGLGYRTGACTEALYVSRDFGFDQGFEFFFENEAWILEETLRAADDFLAREDERPVFLFVHTYRAHSPYRVGAEADASRFEALQARERARRDGPDGPGAITDEELAAGYRELYQGGVRELDRQFGSWLAGLEQRDFFDDGFLVFTSDHGEALFERGRRGHSGRHYQETISIPLLVRGPGLEPRTVVEPASLLDMAVTCAALLGAAPDPGWTGTDLFGLEPDRVLYTFWRTSRSGPWLTVHDGDRKVILLGREEWLRQGRFQSAYDLGRDPGERRRLRPASAPWARELVRGRATEVQHLLQPVVEPPASEISDELIQRLREVGYTGDG